MKKSTCKIQATQLLRAFLVVMVLVSLFVNGCQDNPVAPEHKAISIHVEMGVPTDADAADDYQIVRPQYVLSYNSILNVANWVSWNENASWYGPAERSSTFYPDTTLPSSFVRVLPSDYTSTGYDRGHILGSEARTANVTDNKSTFLMSNIFPQTPDLNRETWYSFESFCDSLCTKANKELYVIAGGVYKTKAKLKNKVTIPDSCWKAVMVLERGQNFNHVTTATQVYAVMMNNGTYTTANNEWRLYKTSVRNIEQQTGYNLFSDLPKNVQDAIETKIW